MRGKNYVKRMIHFAQISLNNEKNFEAAKEILNENQLRNITFLQIYYNMYVHLFIYIQNSKFLTPERHEYGIEHSSRMIE